MLTLNLLPEQSKLEYAFEQKKRLVVFVFIALCGITFMFDALLGSIYVYMKIMQSSVAKELELQETDEGTRQIFQIEKGVKNANAAIAGLTSVVKERRVAGPVLEKIALLAKPGVYLKNLSLDAGQGTVSVDGFAITRELVLDLESMLNKSDFIVPGSVSSPITNIFTSKNIHFSFTFKVRNHP